MRLSERELIDRDRRATERWIREAQLPVLKSMESFDFGAQPGLNEPIVWELLRGDYIARRENVLLVDNPGTGKTHLATALGYAACAQGRRVPLRMHRTTAPIPAAPLRPWPQRVSVPVPITERGFTGPAASPLQDAPWFELV
jgi:hypothetical protein